jgi:hypothetical protein
VRRTSTVAGPGSSPAGDARGRPHDYLATMVGARTDHPAMPDLYAIPEHWDTTSLFS